MRGERTFLEHHALEPSSIVFEQFGRSQIARHEDGVAPQALPRRGAKLARNDPQQAVRQVFQIVHPVGQQRIVDLAHPHPCALLDAFDRRLGGQTGIDRLVDTTTPALVIGEHLVGLEHIVMFAPLAEFGLLAHRVDLVAHLVEGAIDPLALGLGVLGHHLVDLDPWLVEHRNPFGQPLDQPQPVDKLGSAWQFRKIERVIEIDQLLVRDQFGKDHRGGLQRLDLDILVAPLLDMLDAQDTHRAFAIDDRHPGKGMEFLLAGFGAIEEFGVRLGLG